MKDKIEKLLTKNKEKLKSLESLDYFAKMGINGALLRQLNEARIMEIRLIIYDLKEILEENK